MTHETAESLQMPGHLALEALAGLTGRDVHALTPSAPAAFESGSVWLATASNTSRMCAGPRRVILSAGERDPCEQSQMPDADRRGLRRGE
jgi:hypothetical protein